MLLELFKEDIELNGETPLRGHGHC
jgi:hypothetical protein